MLEYVLVKACRRRAHKPLPAQWARLERGVGSRQGRLQRGQIIGGTVAVACCYPELHDGPGVGTIAGQGRGRAARLELIRVAGVVVVARVKRRHRRRRVVIENDGLAGKAAEKSTMTSARSAGPIKSALSGHSRPRCLCGCSHS